MAVYVPPGFYDFIMSLNDEELMPILEARSVISGSRPTTGFPLPIVATKKVRTKSKKATRKVSAYQKRFGRNLKALKAKHPRTDIGILMKKAHRQTRREMR
jgi:hypothetical protein|tara:strand:- start:125 stop:427 length:303 start_codon:yes stop_codon:yes gene_type:complete